MEDYREPFDGRYFGILCAESDDPAPRFLFRSEEEAKNELARRQALSPSEDDWLSHDYVVLPCDIAGAMWNSLDPDPRADNPLSAAEIAALAAGGAP